MKAKIYVLSTVLADENGPAMPAVFVDETEAREKYDEVMRWEWDSMMDPDTDGPYPGHPDEAQERIRQAHGARMEPVGVDVPRDRNSSGETIAYVRGARLSTTETKLRPIHRVLACESLLAQQEEKMTRIPNQWRSSTCSCGSGKPKSVQYDARGIFLTYTCEDCHDRKMAEFRPDVLTDPDYWTDEPIEDDCPRASCPSVPNA